MAEIRFTDEDERLIQSLLEEYDPAKVLASVRMRDMVGAHDWDFILETERNRLERQLRAALVVSALNLKQHALSVVTDLVDDSGDLVEDLAVANRMIAIMDPISGEVSDELGDALGDAIEAAVHTVLGSEPQTKKEVNR